MNSSGKVLLKKSYDEGKDGRINLIIFRYNDEFGTEKKLPKDMTGFVKLEDESAERGLISRFAVNFDDRGFISSMHYRNENQPVGDGEHIYGKRYERDEKGRIIKEYLLGGDDSVRATSWGLGIKQFEYDEKDNWIKAVYLSPDGSPSYDTKDGFSILAMEYDEKYGNLVYSLYQDSDGNLVPPKKDRITGYNFEYNNAGQNTKMFLLGTDKSPAYGIALGLIGLEVEYDDNGYVSKSTSIDENGQPAVRKDGSTFVITRKDSKDNILEKQYFNIDNQPHEIPDGYSREVCEYDQMGNIISIFYYDAKGSLCLSNEGIAGKAFEYNDQNRLVKSQYYGLDKQLCENINGNIIVKIDYNTRGDIIKRAFYEADENTLKLNNQGIAGWKLEYDNQCQQLKPHPLSF
jgi:serine/threonine-protein kinase